MSEPVYGFEAEDVERIRVMLREFESGALHSRNQKRAARLPWRYPSEGGAYFDKLGSSVVAGRTGSSTPYTIAQDTTGVNWGKDDSDKLAQISGGVDAYNYSKLPQPNGRLVPVMNDSGGTPFMLPLWSCFGIQCPMVHAYNASGLSIDFAGRVTLSSWTGPGGASTFDNALWYNLNTDEMELLVSGDYLLCAGAQFQCPATTAAHQAGYLILSDNNNSPLNDASNATATWRSDGSNITYANVSCMTVHSRESGSSNTHAVTPIISVGGSAICTHVWLMVMPCGFGESG